AEKDEPPLVLVVIDLPDDPDLGIDIPVSSLPPGWNDPDNAEAAADFGTRFLKSRTHLYMRVPSVIVHEGVNLVINPLHAAYSQLKLQVARSFRFDPRMFSR